LAPSADGRLCSICPLIDLIYFVPVARLCRWSFKRKPW